MKLSCFFFFLRKTIVSLKAAPFAYRIKKEKACKQQLQMKLLVVRQPTPHSFHLTLNCSPLPFQGTSSHHQPSSSPRSALYFHTHCSHQQPLPERKSHRTALHSDSAATTPPLRKRKGQFREETENFTLSETEYTFG